MNLWSQGQRKENLINHTLALKASVASVEAFISLMLNKLHSHGSVWPGSLSLFQEGHHIKVNSNAFYSTEGSFGEKPLDLWPGRDAHLVGLLASCQG